MAEGGDECWFYNEEVPEYTEEHKNEAISTLFLLARGLTTQGADSETATTFTFLANQLKTMNAANAKEYLILYLNPDHLTNMSNTKSFMYLKKINEDPLKTNMILEKKLAENVVMSLLHLIFYKSLPCPLGNHCKHSPRKIVHKNDFLDMELDCYYYHHEKDHRRFVVSEGQKEFRYAGNFADGKRSGEDKTGFSQNFFESLFHPLYYKNFKCVRTKCEKSVYCPYYHSNEEKTIWAISFRNFVGKDRDVFTKRKGSDEVKTHSNRVFTKRPSQFGKRVAVQSYLMVK